MLALYVMNSDEHEFTYSTIHNSSVTDTDSQTQTHYATQHACDDYEL